MDNFMNYSIYFIGMGGDGYGFSSFPSPLVLNFEV